MVLLFVLIVDLFEFSFDEVMPWWCLVVGTGSRCLNCGLVDRVKLGV